MQAMRGLLAPQNTFLDTIATRFDGTRFRSVQLLARQHWVEDVPWCGARDAFCSREHESGPNQSDPPPDLALLKGLPSPQPDGGWDNNYVTTNTQRTRLHPVVYCSDGFCDLTGFSRAEVMQRGCACSFLYGPDTSELVRQQIRKALDEHKEFKAEIIQDRKNAKEPPYHTATPPASQTLSPSAVPPPLPSHLPMHRAHFHPLFLHPTSSPPSSP
ncbi:Hypothetical predicted protein [Marmota monax]|uniref:PAS domain-containing protein n=1 Tax=Marmota monax TaxID=9995 RepID=A0A5E4BSF0_MARMO|nr:Hypothetical predicted protein [Marmota monax]